MPGAKGVAGRKVKQSRAYSNELNAQLLTARVTKKPTPSPRASPTPALSRVLPAMFQGVSEMVLQQDSPSVPEPPWLQTVLLLYFLPVRNCICIRKPKAVSLVHILITSVNVLYPKQKKTMKKKKRCAV